jgi:hypothetical protein
VSETADQPGSFGWLATEFVRTVPGAAHAVVVSADGLLMAHSRGLPRDRAEQLSSITSGLGSLALAAARCFEAGAVKQTAVEMDNGYLFLIAISDGSFLSVLAAPDCDMGLVAYEMERLVKRVGEEVAPELRTQRAN